MYLVLRHTGDILCIIQFVTFKISLIILFGHVSHTFFIVFPFSPSCFQCSVCEQEEPRSFVCLSFLVSMLPPVLFKYISLCFLQKMCFLCVERFAHCIVFCICSLINLIYFLALRSYTCVNFPIRPRYCQFSISGNSSPVIVSSVAGLDLYVCFLFPDEDKKK